MWFCLVFSWKWFEYKEVLHTTHADTRAELWQEMYSHSVRGLPLHFENNSALSPDSLLQMWHKLVHKYQTTDSALSQELPVHFYRQTMKMIIMQKLLVETVIIVSFTKKVDTEFWRIFLHIYFVIKFQINFL